MDATTIRATATFKKFFPEETLAARILSTTLALLITLAHDDITKAQKILTVQSAILRELSERE